MTDAELYLAIVHRIGGIVDEGVADAVLPACPAWRVRDVVAHLAALAEDWVTDNLDNYASDDWTAAQVERFASLPLADTLLRLKSAATQLVHLADHPAMGPPARFAFGDAVVHEADLRGALGLERVPTDAVAASLKGQIAMWRSTLKRASTPTLLLRTELREWWLGSPDDPEHVSVETDSYEVFRALAGRRSERQVRAWRWSKEPAPFLACGLPYPFSFASSAIDD